MVPTRAGPGPSLVAPAVALLSAQRHTASPDPCGAPRQRIHAMVRADRMRRMARCGPPLRTKRQRRRHENTSRQETWCPNTSSAPALPFPNEASNTSSAPGLPPPNEASNTSSAPGLPPPERSFEPATLAHCWCSRPRSVPLAIWAAFLLEGSAGLAGRCCSGPVPFGWCARACAAGVARLAGVSSLRLAARGVADKNVLLADKAFYREHYTDPKNP